METIEHQKRLQRVYASAPIMRFYNTSYLRFLEEGTTTTLTVESKYFHGQRALHNSVYFRMLEDAAYFACAAQEPDFHLSTSSFTTNFEEPVSTGKIKAIGTVLKSTKDGYTATAELKDENDVVLATGKGTYKRTEMKWAKVFGYSS